MPQHLIFAKAADFAAFAHKDQKIPGSETPYIAHPIRVMLLALEVFSEEPTLDKNLLVACALMHDCIEDTEATYEQLEAEFGKTVADGVLALTKNEALPKETRMGDSLDRILSQSPEIAVIKLCDRIDNLSKPPHYWTSEKKQGYLAEAGLILEKLGPASPKASEMLTHKMQKYPSFF